MPIGSTCGAIPKGGLARVRSSVPSRGAGLFHSDGRICALGRTGLTMFDVVLGGAVALAITGYLVFALVRPERF
ncbi:MAG: K(+)-transporting ATPase subunit F [Fulvimarina manganoxydans]|nr:K(+)-transporting ATPase subunit F [Fulvimarina manganoxydans]